VLNVPEEIKALYRRNRVRDETIKKLKLRFYDKVINFPNPDDTPMLVIGPEQISYESFTLTQTLCDNTSLTFGDCCAARVEIVVADILMDVTGKWFTLLIEVGGYEMVLGIYKVKSFERQADRRLKKIVAHDRMLNFDVDVSEWYRGLTFPMKLKQFRSSLCTFVGMQQQAIILPLDDMEVTRSIDPSKLSGRDVMKSICEINGCFGQIDNTGKFKYVFLGSSGLYPSEELFPADDLYPSEMQGENLSHLREATYEDFLVKGIDKVQIRQEEGDVGAAYGLGTNTYTIQGNFLVYGKNAQELHNIAATVHENIGRKTYRPCKIVTQALPWVEPGDGIICYTSDDVIETYCLKRTIKGIQAMMDTFEAQGTMERKENFGIDTQIIQLEGKTAIIKKSVEEVSVRVSDLKASTDAQFKITADQILAEVTRAKQSETSLSIRADQIAISVTNLTNDTNSRFTQTASQIALKVSKGEVSSQLSVEPNAVTIKTNRLSWESNYSSMTSDGKLTCRNIVATNGTFTGNLESQTFYANGGAVGFGDYYVSANGSNLLRSTDGSVVIQTAQGGPFGKYASINLSSQAGTTILSDHHLETPFVNARQINGDCELFGNNWWQHYSLFGALDYLYNKIESLVR
jgi:uncharacterized protein YlzI (FlbEa/FlbD family)